MTGKSCEEVSSSEKSKKRDFKGASDFISSLPQEVLGNILSRLPTKLAASTSVLSKKWRHLFALVHNLEFDDSVFVKPLQSDNENTVECFKSFVDRTLALQCGSSISKFSLKFLDFDNSHMDSLSRWISNVVERGVSEFCLCLRHIPPPERPYLDLNPLSELFRSNTLVKLTLGKRLIIHKFPSNVYLPALKILLIKSIAFKYQDAHSLSVLLAGCPVLEELSIRHVTFEGYYFCICSQTIKKLTIYYNNERFVFCGFEMSIDTPNLVSLDYNVIAARHDVEVNFKSLVEAKLDLTFLITINGSDLANLINGLSNVQTLHLSPDTVDVICSYGLLLPMFINLVNLSFGSYNANGWNMLTYLLKHTPKLETLTIQSLEGSMDNLTLRPYQVKVLRVLGFENTREEKKNLLRLVWRNECLKQVEMEIKKSVVTDHHTISKKVERLLKIAAPNCNINLKIS